MEVWCRSPVTWTGRTLSVGSQQIIQAWEQPLMVALAEEVTLLGGDILEIGFGMGMSAEAIVRAGCASYTVIEAHPAIAERARLWAHNQEVPTRILEGFWQDWIYRLDEHYDGILFDACPVDEAERDAWHYPFIPQAPRLLRPSGILTYYGNETGVFPPEHMRLLRKHFPKVRLRRVEGLKPDSNCEYWQADHMIIPISCKTD